MSPQSLRTRTPLFCDRDDELFRGRNQVSPSRRSLEAIAAVASVLTWVLGGSSEAVLLLRISCASQARSSASNRHALAAAQCSMISRGSRKLPRALLTRWPCQL